jgi:hypothetical protein
MAISIKKIAFAALGFLLAGNVQAATGFDFGSCKIELPDSAEAAAIVGTPDTYTNALQKFDLTVRIGAGATAKDYLAAAQKAVRTWPQEEQAALKKSFGEIEAFLKSSGIKLNLPASIRMIKTTAGEEFGAEGYTRANNIMLNTAAEPVGVHLVAHELFHVFSRYNTATRDALYANINFKKCNPIAYSAALGGRTITNPDCPVLEHYVTLDKEGAKKDMVLVLYSKNDLADKTPLGDFIQIGLLEVRGDDAHKAPLVVNGSGVINDLDKTPDLFNKVGTNTQYLLHPEEICAEHFAALVSGAKVPQPGYLEKMKAVLKQ